MFCTFLSSVISICYLHKTKAAEVSHRYQVKTTNYCRRTINCAQIYFIYISIIWALIQHNSARQDLTDGCCALHGAGLDPNCIHEEAMSPALRGCDMQPLTEHFSIPFQTENIGRKTTIHANYRNHWDAFQDPTVSSVFSQSSYFAVHEVFQG